MKFINQVRFPSLLISLSLLGGFIGGFFGSGGGVVFVFILKKFFGCKKEIFPTVIMITLFSSAVNSVFYSHSGNISELSPVYFFSGIAGALCGCIFFDRIKFKFLNIAFAILTAVCGAVMIF